MSKLILDESNSANRVYTEIYDTGTGVTRKGYTIDGKFLEFSDKELRLIKENSSIEKEKNSSTKRPISKPRRPRLDPNRYISIYDDGIWRKNAEEAGVTDRDSVKALQKKLGVEVDGIWGKNTNAAYEVWKLKNSTPVVETVTTQTVLAPAVYQSTYDYNNADDFKNLGFNDYNSLKSWVKANPEHPFAKDMLERFKDTDLWTQNNIESDLGIKGKYRSGYQGDLYDIRKSMQNYFKNLYNIDKNNEYTTQILQNMNNMNNYVQNLANRFSFLKKQFKNGGLLVSKNSIERFQQGNKFKNSWRFDRRSVDLSNGHSVVSDWIYLDYDNGLYTGDNPPTVAGRTIYVTPTRNDTVFWKTPDNWVDTGHGYMPVPKKSLSQNSAKRNFYNWTRKTTNYPYDKISNPARIRALRGN